VQTLEDGDMALLDMGAEYHFYGSDTIMILLFVSLSSSYILYSLTSDDFMSNHNDPFIKKSIGILERVLN